MGSIQLQKKAPVPEVSVQEEHLLKFGGFELLESAIEGAQNLNPERKARREIFLSEATKQGDRDTLKKSLILWHRLLSNATTAAEMRAYCDDKIKLVSGVLLSNLKMALDAIKGMEKSYRNIALFFANTGQDKVKNVSFLNASLTQLKDLDNTQFIDAVQAELVKNYDRLDLRDNYSLLVIPGYLGSNILIEKWAKIAYNNKAMLVTDFAHLDAPDDVMEMFDAANLTGGEIHRSNVMMLCNWIIGREKYLAVGEEEHLYIPPSGAYAGKIYQTLMSQVAAGKKFGSLDEVEAVKFALKKSEVAVLEKMGLIPLVKEYGKVMAFSAKTLFNGDNLGLQTYSVVRVFDFVTKVLMDFLNRRAFENFNANTRKDVVRQIVRFLDGITGPDKLIEDFSIQRFEQDPRQKDRVYLDVHLKPYFPAKNFLIKMDGQKGDEGTDWDTAYEQEPKK